MEAFAALFEPLRHKLHAVACRLVGPSDAEDVVMDTYLKAWHALPRFGGQSTLNTWMFRIAHNRAMDLLRQRQGRATKEVRGEDAEKAIEHATDPRRPTAAEELQGRELQGLVRQAVDQLPEPHRTTLLMRYADDLSYAEIAAAAGVSIGTVMSRLFHARLKLRHVWESLTANQDGTI